MSPLLSLECRPWSEKSVDASPAARTSAFLITAFRVHSARFPPKSCSNVNSQRGGPRPQALFHPDNVCHFYPLQRHQEVAYLALRKSTERDHPICKPRLVTKRKGMKALTK